MIKLWKSYLKSLWESTLLCGLIYTSAHGYTPYWIFQAAWTFLGQSDDWILCFEHSVSSSLLLQLRGEVFHVCGINILMPWGSSGAGLLAVTSATESLQKFGTWRKTGRERLIFYFVTVGLQLVLLSLRVKKLQRVQNHEGARKLPR